MSMDPETLLDVLAAIPGVYVVENGTNRAFGGWPKVAVTLALDPREPDHPEFTVRIAPAPTPEPSPPNVTLERPNAAVTPDRALVELRAILDLDADATWADVISYTAKSRGAARMSNATVRRRCEQLAEVLGTDAVAWPALLAAVRTLVAQAGEAVRTS